SETAPPIHSLDEHKAEGRGDDQISEDLPISLTDLITMAQRYMNAEDAINACDDFDANLKGKKRWDEL
ncbi:hypothetical protein FCV25MIE_01180, partial [Fagus crenata]